MLEEFVFPNSDPHRGGLREADANSSCIADVLDDLRENDALYITEDANFERCEELARRFTRLDIRHRAAAVDVLAANLSQISTSAKGLLSDQDAALPAAAMRHRNGIKMLVYLLHFIARQAAKDTQALKGAENAAKPKTAGRGRKTVVMDMEDDNNWDWEQGKQRVLSAVRDLITLVDLKALFKGLAAVQQLINLCMELALQGLEAPNIAKQESNWPACRDVLVRGAVQYQQSDFIAHALMELLRKHEHMPQLAALIAKYAEEHYNNTQLAVMLLTEFSAVAPEDYDVQYSTNQVSVRLAGDLVAALAELMPKVVSNQISQLQPYLGCSKAYCLRGSLLQAIGSMLVQVYRSDNLSSSLGAGAAAAHLRSKDTLLALLHARVLDKVSFVRQKVLQTWGKLVEESCVPISHWNMLLQQAIGRLEDDSQLVVKAALQLLHKMVAQGLFQPPLKTHIYVNTLQQAEAELAKLQPAKAAVGEEEEEEGGEHGDDEAAAGGDADADGARWEEGDIRIKEEPTEQPMPYRDDAADISAEGGKAISDGAIQRMRTMVASLKEGVSFCKRLAATLPQLQVLLANPAANVVHDAIVFLTLCKTFEVTGAAKALRGMWPLVFSKHEPVRGAVLDSWHILHLHDKLPKQQMEELVMHVIPDCSLSELTALESIIASLVQQDKLSAASLVKQLMVYAVGCIHQSRQLPAAVGTREASKGADMDIDIDEDHSSSSTASVEEQRVALQSTVRHAFTLLSILTAAQPTALAASYLPVLIEVGLATYPLDAWVARHTCLALQYAAPQLTGRAAALDHAGTSSSIPMTPDTHQAVLASLVRLLVASPCAAVAPNWPSAAEAAVAAVYALSPQPQELMAAVLAEMFRRCASPGGEDDDSTIHSYSAAALSRFFFVLGRTSLQHLLNIEQTSKAIRAARLAADRAAAEAVERQMSAAAGSSSGGARRGKASASASAASAVQPAPEDIGAQLGVGSVAADAELDALAETIEAQVLAKDQLLGTYGQLLSKLLHLKSTLAAPQELQESALLALTQLMAVDSTFCADNLRLLFTLLLQRHVSGPMRVNMVVALADLASRFPNLLEPWTAEIYLTLADPDPAVKLSALTSLTHLVLGGMVKAKGRNVAHVAVLLVDDVQDINDRAVLFFESLAKTGSGNTRSAAAAAGASAANPVYNLLPDCLSTLLTMKDLREEQLQVIMGHLLAFVKDKQAESLRERLVGRLQVGGPREWRLVAWCVGQLGYSDKGLRRIMEMTASYRHALGEQQVFDVFTTMAEKARRSAGSGKTAAADETNSGLPDAPSDLRSAVEEWMADLTASREAALEAAEVEAMLAGRNQQQQHQEPEEGAQEENVTMEPQADTAEQQQDQQQQTDADKSDEVDGEPKERDSSNPDVTTAANQRDPTQQGAAAEAGTIDTAAGVSEAEEEQIELLQSQTVADDEATEEASAEAAALQKHMERLSMAPTSARAARQSQRPAAATAGAGNKKAAGAAARKGGSRAARSTKQTAKAAEHRSAECGSRAEDRDAGDDSSSDDSCSDFETHHPVAPRNVRSRAGRGRSSTAGKAAGSASSNNSHKQAPQQRQPQMHDSGGSSEDDD